jgi:hypothetical protein
MVYYVQPYKKQGVHSEKKGVDLVIPKLSNYYQENNAERIHLLFM